VVIDKNKGQLENTLISVKFLSQTEYQLKIKFDSNKAPLIRYLDNSKSKTNVVQGDFIKRYKVGQQVSLPFLNWKLQINDNPGFYKGNEYYVRFNDFDKVVSKYRGINVDIDTKAPSILKLSLTGTNKIDWLII